MTHGFSVGEAVKAAWDKVTGHFWLCCGVVLFVGVVPAVAQVALFRLADTMTHGAISVFPFLTMLIGLAGFAFQALIQMGIFRFVLNILDDKDADFTDLFSNFPLLANFVTGSLLYSIIVSVGLILLIVPGIIFAIQFGFYNYAIVDKGLGPIEALKFSSQITKGNKWTLFGLALLSALITLAGSACLIVGLIPASAICLVAYAYAYRQLAANSNSPDSAVATMH